ncbi:hypothetical protein JTB14_025799 [Gonioctena quinquepunctata]|nr:hypothetical protein JTB14_025799 [Gonioctena quinquepunctata]
MKLLRSTAWVLRFTKCYRKRCRKGDIGADEICEAELLWWKHVQRNCFDKDIRELKTGQDLKNRKIEELCPYMDKVGILRVRSRITEDIIGF